MIHGERFYIRVFRVIGGISKSPDAQEEDDTKVIIMQDLEEEVVILAVGEGKI